jgi:hypothetical protein
VVGDIRTFPAGRTTAVTSKITQYAGTILSARFVKYDRTSGRFRRAITAATIGR